MWLKHILNEELVNVLKYIYIYHMGTYIYTYTYIAWEQYIWNNKVLLFLQVVFKKCNHTWGIGYFFLYRYCLHCFLYACVFFKVHKIWKDWNRVWKYKELSSVFLSKIHIHPIVSISFLSCGFIKFTGNQC